MLLARAGVSDLLPTRGPSQVARGVVGSIVVGVIQRGSLSNERPAYKGVQSVVGSLDLDGFVATSVRIGKGDYAAYRAEPAQVGDLRPLLILAQDLSRLCGGSGSVATNWLRLFHT